MNLSTRSLVLVASVAAALLALFLFTSPLPQDPAYHDFADKRTIMGVSNFGNVMSNLPFLVVGLWGAWYVLRHSHHVCVPGSMPKPNPSDRYIADPIKTITVMCHR